MGRLSSCRNRGGPGGRGGRLLCQARRFWAPGRFSNRNQIGIGPASFRAGAVPPGDGGRDSTATTGRRVSRFSAKKTLGPATDRPSSGGWRPKETSGQPGPGGPSRRSAHGEIDAPGHRPIGLHGGPTGFPGQAGGRTRKASWRQFFRTIRPARSTVESARLNRPGREPRRSGRAGPSPAKRSRGPPPRPRRAGVPACWTLGGLFV